MYDNTLLNMVYSLRSDLSLLLKLLLNSFSLYFGDIVGDGGKDAP